MSNVTLEIVGRRYTIACAPGEEAHIEALGESIKAKLAKQGVTGQTAERTLLFAALLLADELHEAQTGASASVHSAQPPPAAAIDETETARLEQLAERLELLAERLENGVAAS
ncbi:cell division protein ZapA [Aurantiacibacter spongiae]|uniref:Cell division protein ZapA n=1 Tax=Aurantiacibacter spongiae TaxID=2488860 RepID=A0A3N5DFR4_9SPHN|nr:cell division protein ZapA [Aurantiacibacter spongiae]RPF70492.1 cell division protein ZapA [Aurantiacibacter spongiae]